MNLKRLIVAIGLVAGLLLFGGAPLMAYADEPVTIGMSDVTANESGVTGVLTLRSKSPTLVDPGSLKATIDGKAAPVSIKQAPKLERRAMIVIDTSGSMGTSGMQTVRTAMAQYLKSVPDDVLVGVATFADTAGVDLAPTADRAAVQRVVDGLEARGNTSLYAGMQSAVKALGKKGDRSIVLLSDGADTVANNRDAALAKTTAALKNAGVRTDVVQFKTTDPDAVTSLRAFTKANGGSLVPAGDTAAVAAAFQQSAKALDSQVQFTVQSDSKLAGAHELALSGTAGGTNFNFARTVTAAAAATPTPKPTPTDSGAAAVALPPGGPLPLEKVQPWLIWVAAALVALALFTVTATMMVPTLQTRREARVASIESYVVGSRRSRADRQPRSTPITEQLVAFGDQVMKRRTSTKGTMALIERADLPFRAGEWFILQGVSTIVCVALAFVLMRDASGLGLLIAIVIGALLGLLIPRVVLRSMASRRAKKFERVLPDVLTLVATSLRSGFGLPQALDAVARDAAEPAAKEFSRALAETRIGTDVSDALEHMADRMGSVAMRWTVMAIRIQRDVGGNLADTLTTTSKTLRDRDSLRRLVSTLSAEGRLSAYILIALPIAMFFYMTLVNYEYVSLLWTRTLGLVMLIGVGILMVIGIFWMRRVVKIEV
ncbi:tight adherence protein B [Humibacillus xanthopallidus]|uniref:Tight adherence protein B n=1 Tax=Humibacillus xanthopallidus TaxID=412689 RepID=A0A543PMD8_9MICO|nr:type II secretion system F family protein [Humibacillus xanthopallidus]TQN45245.1 tight adherence protein B [Humibacillus xanthopallidus]